MRILLSLKSLKSLPQSELKKFYFTSMHGLITKYNQTSYFSFGNLFPIFNKKLEENKVYHIMISSDDSKFIEKLFFNIPNLINLGEAQFELIGKEINFDKLKNDSIIESIHPINVTIHNEDKIRSLKYEDEDYLNYLQNSLINKYNKITKNSLMINLFENVEIKVHEKNRSDVFRINFYNKQKNNFFNVIGSKLVFKFNNISDKQLKVFQTLYDTGFGERCHFGAGFMIERWKK